jgi:hypothetical protein
MLSVKFSDRLLVLPGGPRQGRQINPRRALHEGGDYPAAKCAGATQADSGLRYLMMTTCPSGVRTNSPGPASSVIGSGTMYMPMDAQGTPLAVFQNGKSLRLACRSRERSVMAAHSRAFTPGAAQDSSNIFHGSFLGAEGAGGWAPRNSLVFSF